MKSRNTMYYKKPTDREQMRDSDLGTEDSSDPMETDGYGEEEEIPGEPGGPAEGFSVSLTKEQVTGLAAKLRKKGAPAK